MLWCDIEIIITRIIIVIGGLLLLRVGGLEVFGVEDVDEEVAVFDADHDD